MPQTLPIRTLIAGAKSADYEIRCLDAVLDEEDGEPLLNEGLLKLGEWMAGYYLAPLGEVLRDAPANGRGETDGVLPHH